MFDEKGFLIGTSQEAIDTLNKGYLKKNETVEGVFDRVCNGIANYYNNNGVADDLHEALCKRWIGLATPVFVNAFTDKNLPISCYTVHPSDSIKSIFETAKEIAMLTKGGGGVGVYLGDIRDAGSPITGGGEASGSVPVAETYDKGFDYVSQNNVRRGAGAFYEKIRSKDAPRLLESKSHTGDPRKYIDSTIALTVPNEFMESVLAGNPEDTALWAKVLETQMKAGSPYLFFTDNVNDQNPECYKNLGLKVSSSNICTEIVGHTDENHTFVCCLSSLNLLLFDDWVNWRGESTGLSLPQLCVYLLDAVMQDFIDRAPADLEKAIRFAVKGRMLG